MDSLGKIYVEPTGRCNLDCTHCVRHAWEEDPGDMAWEVFEALIDGLAEFPHAHTVAFAGCGEPLLHPRLPDMIRLAHEKGLRTEITSNALPLTATLAHDLVRAGLDQFVVSIDGVSERSYQAIRGASLTQVKDNVRTLTGQRMPKTGRKLRIGIEFVAMRRNIHELPTLHVVAKSIGASFILVTNVLPYTPELQNEILYNLSATAVERRESYETPLWSIPRMDWNRHTKDALAGLFQGRAHLRLLDVDLDQRNNTCPFIRTGSLAVAWSGTVSPCPPLMHSYTCYVKGRRKHIRRYEVGRLTQRPLRAIWDDEDYRRFRRRVRAFDFPPCIDCVCERAESNEEDCWGNPFPVCGDCLWARGIIRCA